MTVDFVSKLHPRQLIREFQWLRHKKALLDIEFLVLDVDGVLTDGGLWFDSRGEIMKRFDVRDGLGLRLLDQEGLTVAFLSGARGGGTEERANQLGINYCLVGIKDKMDALISLQKKLNFSRENTAFVGDDLNDLTIRAQVKFLFAPADACRPVRRQADAVLQNCGGHGAVRELSERLLQARGRWVQLQREGWRDRNG